VYVAIVLRGHSATTLLFSLHDTATTEIYTLSLHDALPICLPDGGYTEVHTPPDEELEAHLRGKETVPVLTSAPPGAVPGPVGRLRARISAAYGGEKVPLDEDRERSLTPRT